MRLKLEQLESKVAEQVIGNETLVKRITDAIVASFFRARSGNDPRPMLTYAIFGPSGNGKSTLIKAIADALGIKMTTIDGAKATERDIIGENSSALMRESNQDHLVANVRKTPMQILYFNEMNLANPKVFELLEKILEDGKLADRSGKEAKFENTIVIIDANVAVETIRMLGVSEGKEVTDTQRELIEQMTKNQSELSYPEGSVHLTPEAAAVVKREITAGLGNRAALMGRISNIEVLGYLSKTQAEGIADLLVKQINKRLVEEKGVSLTADKAAREALGELAMQPQNREEGARPIRSQIDRVTDPVIKDLILNQRNWNESGEFIGRYEIQITAVDGVITAKAVVKPEVSAEAAP
jgi:ATP-dependent Clp protease ATP-binding subunit ClpC